MNELDIPNYGTVIICPYNKSHVILVERIQRHLFKCRRQHPNAEIDICIFNTSHHVPRAKLQEHQKSCPDRALIEVEMYMLDDGSNNPVNRPKEEEPVYADGAPPMVRNDDENWDDMDAPRYDPEVYCRNNPVVRKTMHMTKSEKKKFRAEERIRIATLNKAYEEENAAAGNSK